MGKIQSDKNSDFEQKNKSFLGIKLNVENAVLFSGSLPETMDKRRKGSKKDMIY